MGDMADWITDRWCIFDADEWEDGVETPHCPTCGSLGDLTESPWGYRYECVPCGTRVGCHPGTTHALGTMADAETRQLRINAHALFDPIWRDTMRRRHTSKRVARSDAYQWLAAALALPVEDCHIAMLDAAGCRRVMAACVTHPVHTEV